MCPRGASVANPRKIKGDDMPALLHPLAWYLIGLALGGALVWAVLRG